MIEETVLVIDQLEEREAIEREARYARRNKIRYVDEMLNELEILNLADELEIPLELIAQVSTFLGAERHIVCERGLDEVTISDWMEALYDIQDTLMIPFEDDLD